MSSPTVTSMTTVDAISLLHDQEVGRLNLDRDGYPVALPVNYTVDERSGGIAIRTPPHSAIGSFEGFVIWLAVPDERP
jgi:nitroimidazol reductase NimA-like FMN-containing flavoprotein (pyridoxamine 5'-phosphate oxidase superfamily)